MAIVGMAGTEAPSVDQPAGFDTISSIKGIRDRLWRKPAILDSHANTHDRPTRADLGKRSSKA